MAARTSVLLDIGGDVGALVLTVPDRYRGREIEVSPVGDDARRTHTAIDVEFQTVRDGFRLDQNDPLVESFQESHAAASNGRTVPFGSKPFCDDCNTFWALAKIPGITHGPTGGGAHTLNEWVSIDDLVRVAHVYALTAASYCTVSA